MIKKHFSIVIYFLSTILVLILSIFIYRIITHTSYVYVQDQINISKYTGERISNPYVEKSSKIATYINTSKGGPLIGLSSADVVLEFLSGSSGITYKAIFNQAVAKNISGINLKKYSNSYLPKFNFSNNIALSDINSKNATNIFVTFDEGSSSNFLYQNGEYYHYRGLKIDKDNDSPVKLSNVVIQFIHGTITNDDNLTSSENYGTGLLFCGGMAQNIKWIKKVNSPIKINDEKGGEVSLMPGTTWWIFIDADSSVAYD
ncbi:DUF3048 C-terminal domain-containing protein [Clostridium estertheticum]|uniref:DUF3048 C-terminal domain-containing protein n=1 Tax=Clostridium estertheticum TaxID=238834 RepID=UPI0013E8FAA0|nr:DUF3048 C-terminal domain-containing protein [Clostridium estertheticum]MBZ9689437.1 DUF3048 C-terminal domain-containing protein [Clostridium estertheticum]